MTDKEIIEGLIEHDNQVTAQFFYVKCRPLLTAIMRMVFTCPVDYDEMVNELYKYLLDDNGARLRQFQYRSTVYQWIKVVATRFFIRYRDNLVAGFSKESSVKISGSDEMIDPEKEISERMDVAMLLNLMGNQRYAQTIRHLVLEDTEPEKYALEIGVTIENLYNIKKRAMSAFTRIATKYYGYGR